MGKEKISKCLTRSQWLAQGPYSSSPNPPSSPSDPNKSASSSSPFMLSKSMPLSAAGALLCSLPAGLWSRPARPGRRTTSSSDEDIMRDRNCKLRWDRRRRIPEDVLSFFLLRSFTFPRRHDDPSRTQLGLAPAASPRARPKEAIHTNSQRPPSGACPCSPVCYLSFCGLSGCVCWDPIDIQLRGSIWRPSSRVCKLVLVPEELP